MAYLVSIYFRHVFIIEVLACCLGNTCVNSCMLSDSLFSVVLLLWCPAIMCVSVCVLSRQYECSSWYAVCRLLCVRRVKLSCRWPVQTNASMLMMYLISVSASFVCCLKKCSLLCLCDVFAKRLLIIAARRLYVIVKRCPCVLFFQTTVTSLPARLSQKTGMFDSF